MATSPTANNARVALRALRPLTTYLRHIGQDATRFLTEAGIDPIGLFDPSATIPHPLLLDRWRRAEELCKDPNIGLRVIEHIPFRMFAHMPLESEWIIVQMFLCSATVGDGLVRFAKYFPVSFFGCRIAIARQRGLVHVNHSILGAGTAPRGFSEFVMGLVVRLMHELASRPVKPREVRFAHEAPPTLADHERILIAPTRFSAGEDTLLLDEADLAVSMRTENARLLPGLELHGDHALARLPPIDSLVDQVRALIAAELPRGNPNSNHIASALQMSVRTLSRRLDEMGTSHKVILDDVRSGLAKAYLLEEKRSVSEVASLLGFSEVSAFHRAFRRWFGVSPTDFCRGAGPLK